MQVSRTVAVLPIRHEPVTWNIRNQKVADPMPDPTTTVKPRSPLWRLLVGVALVAASVLIAGQRPGTISLPAMTCHAIIDAAKADGTLDGDGDLDACIAEGESQDRETQIAIAEAIFDEDDDR